MLPGRRPVPPVFRNAAFYVAKGRLLHGERWPFAWRFAAFWNVAVGPVHIENVILMVKSVIGAHGFQRQISNFACNNKINLT